MTNKLTNTAAIVGTMALLLTAGIAQADDDDARALRGAKISLNEAIRAAESAGGAALPRHPLMTTASNLNMK